MTHAVPAEMRAPRERDRRLVRAAATRAHSRSAVAVGRTMHDLLKCAHHPWLRPGEDVRIDGGRVADDALAHVLVAVRAGRKAPHHARHAVAEYLGEVLPPEVLGDLELLTTEVVTNAVVHGGVDAGKVIRLHAVAGLGGVMVRVIDQGPGFDPAAARRAPGADGGWGLGIVDQLSRDWGVIRRASGSSVWFRLRF